MHSILAEVIARAAESNDAAANVWGTFAFGVYRPSARQYGKQASEMKTPALATEEKTWGLARIEWRGNARQHGDYSSHTGTLLAAEDDRPIHVKVLAILKTPDGGPDLAHFERAGGTAQKTFALFGRSIS